MKTTIDVKDRREAQAIREGLLDPATRALVIVMGLLRPLASDRSRARVLTYVIDKLNEADAQRQAATS